MVILQEVKLWSLVKWHVLNSLLVLKVAKVANMARGGAWYFVISSPKGLLIKVFIGGRGGKALKMGFAFRGFFKPLDGFGKGLPM